MRIIITGGAGFVGSSLCIYLKRKYPKYDIVAFDNLRRRGSELNLTRLREQGVLFVHGDIRNAEDFHVLGECDLLVDACADPSVLSGISSPVLPVINANLIGTVNALEFASSCQAKFIFMSTSRVYPIEALESAAIEELETRYMWLDAQQLSGISSKGVSESFPLHGSRSFYGASKLASELLIEEYREHKGVPSIINRFGVIGGPWQMGKVDQGVLILWLARHFFKGKLNYIGYEGSGKQTRDILHIDDAVELIDIQIHDFDKYNGLVSNVGGGLECSFSLRELTALCSQVTDNKIEVGIELKNRPADLRIYITDNTAIKQVSGWSPKRTLEDIVRDSFIWIQENEGRLKSILE